MSVHTIENCGAAVIKNGLLYIRGGSSVQCKLDEVYIIQYNEQSKTLLLNFGTNTVQTIMPKDTTVQFFLNTLPSYFSNVYENSLLTCFNMLAVSFIELKENTIYIQFTNGFSLNITGKDVQSTFINMCSVLEYIV